ncbi:MULTISPECIES: AI-2E family transporter [Gracilibacillus]|uniref:AI-2E family transporter n=1 Tax=Gracilibacillus TaxID=74385 RepID=UPI000825B2DD|nr:MULTISPECIES: AI-2E family transporter [Gracilibacillus]
MNQSHDRLIKFLGGKNILFILGTLILIGITVIVYNQISFIFHPFHIVFSTIFPPVILAFVAYYLLNPIVNLLEKWRIKRVWGIILIILAFSGIITGILFIIIPIIETQIKELVSNFPGYVSTINEGVNRLMSNSIFANYFNEARSWVESNLGELPSRIMSQLGNTMEGVANFASTLTNIIVSLITFPFVLFFLLKDGQRFKNYCLKLFPRKYRKDVTNILHKMDTQVGSYIQGQIFVALCIGLLLYIGYLIIGLDYAIILAGVAAITSVVPYLGPIIAITPAIIISLVTSPWMLLKLGIVWAVVQFAEGHFISPNVMGKTMKVHPLTIMFVLLVAGKLFGIVGVILGIPGYAVGKVLVTFVFRKFKARYNRYFDEGFEDKEVAAKEQ